MFALLWATSTVDDTSDMFSVLFVGFFEVLQSGVAYVQLKHQREHLIHLLDILYTDSHICFGNFSLLLGQQQMNQYFGI